MITGAQIRKARELLGWRQAELVKQARIRRIPSRVRKIVTLSHSSRVSTSELFRQRSNPPAVEFTILGRNLAGSLTSASAPSRINPETRQRTRSAGSTIRLRQNF
jgi:hypothetical protein